MSFMSPRKVKSAIFPFIQLMWWREIYSCLKPPYGNDPYIMRNPYNHFCFGLVYLYFCLNALNAIELNCLKHINFLWKINSTTIVHSQLSIQCDVNSLKMLEQSTPTHKINVIPLVWINKQIEKLYVAKFGKRIVTPLFQLISIVFK